jgi:hypothetical protein
VPPRTIKKGALAPEDLGSVNPRLITRRPLEAIATSQMAIRVVGVNAYLQQ